MKQDPITWQFLLAFGLIVLAIPLSLGGVLIFALPMGIVGGLLLIKEMITKYRQ